MLSARFMTLMTLLPVLLLGMLFSPAVGPLFLPAVGPLFCHPSRCSGPQASSLVSSSELLASCLQHHPVVFTCAWSGGLQAPLSLLSARCACRERRLLEILQRAVAFSSSSLAVLRHSMGRSSMAVTWLSGVASREPLFSTSCLPVHVLTHVFSSARFSRARLLWHIVVLGGLLD